MAQIDALTTEALDERGPCPEPGDLRGVIDLGASGGARWRRAVLGTLGRCRSHRGLGTDKVDRVITKECGVVPVTADYAIDGATLTQ